MELMQAAVLCVVTGGVSSLLTIGAIKVDLKNLRDTVRRIDAVATRANETSISNKVKIGILEARHVSGCTDHR